MSNQPKITSFDPLHLIACTTAFAALLFGNYQLATWALFVAVGFQFEVRFKR